MLVCVCTAWCAAGVQFSDAKIICNSNKEHIANLISIPPGHATLHRSENLFLSNAHVVSNISKQCGLYVVPGVPYLMPCNIIRSVFTVGSM
jgi:hypothetical protein